MATPKRVVVWFSAGVTSAVAAKLADERYAGGPDVLLVNTDTGSEDEDNQRFMEDVAEWLSLPLVVLRSDKYEDTFDVYRKTGYMKNQYGARCSTELKRRVREQYQEPGDLHVFGFDYAELHRAERFTENNPELICWFPLIEARIDKMQARSILLSAGISEPRTYAEGFTNANCLARGCVKGGLGYWNFMRTARPEVFENMAKMEREIGYALNHYETVKDGQRIKTPVYLDELDPGAGNYKTEPAIQCGLFCGSY